MKKDNYYVNLIFHTELTLGFPPEFFDINRTNSILIVNNDKYEYHLFYKGKHKSRQTSNSIQTKKALEDLLRSPPEKFFRGLSRWPLKKELITTKLMSLYQTLRTLTSGNFSIFKDAYEVLKAKKELASTIIWPDIDTSIQNYELALSEEGENATPEFKNVISDSHGENCGFFTINSTSSITRTDIRYYKYPLNDLTSVVDKIGLGLDFEWLTSEIVPENLPAGDGLYTYFKIKYDSPIFRMFYLGNLLIEKLREKYCALPDFFNGLTFESMGTLVQEIIDNEDTYSKIDGNKHQMPFSKFLNKYSRCNKGYVTSDYICNLFLGNNYANRYSTLIINYFSKIYNKATFVKPKNPYNNNSNPDFIFLINLLNVLIQAMRNDTLINNTNKLNPNPTDTEWIELIPLIGFFIPEIIPDRGKVYNCENNVTYDGVKTKIPKLYLKSINKSGGGNSIDFDDKLDLFNLFKKAYYWDFIHDYAHSGERKKKILEVERARLGKKGQTIENIYENIFRDTSVQPPKNFGNVENLLLGEINELFKNLNNPEILKYHEPPNPQPNNNPKYWINNASNFQLVNKICTYGSMLDSQGYCGNCILYIPKQHGEPNGLIDYESGIYKNSQYKIFIEKIEQDITYDINIKNLYKIDITYQVIRLKEPNNINIIKKINNVDCFICVLVTTQIKVTLFNGGYEHTFDYLSAKYENNQDSLPGRCFHSENSYTKKEQIKQFVMTHLNRLNDDTEGNYTDEGLKNILNNSIFGAGNECRNLLIYGTIGAQNFCNAKSVAANVCSIENYIGNNSIILRGNYFKKYIGDHLQELELFFLGNYCNIFGLLNNDRPSAARVIIFYLTFGLEHCDEVEDIGNDYYKHKQYLDSIYKNIVNFSVIKTGGAAGAGAGAAISGSNCNSNCNSSSCVTNTIVCTFDKFEQWLQENELRLINDENIINKYKIIYDNIKDDPISLDFFVIFIRNDGRFLEVDISINDSVTTILSAIYGLDNAELDDCSCMSVGGSKRKKGGRKKTKTKRKNKYSKRKSKKRVSRKITKKKRSRKKSRKKN